MKISFLSDVNMISFSVPPSLGLLLIVLLPSHCSNVLPLWLRSGGFSSCGCQFVKQEQVLRGQGASLKDSLYSHLPGKHWCTCFFQYAHHCSSDFFVLSADMFYPQSPGAVSDFKWQQFSAQRIRKENLGSKLCSHPTVKMQKYWGLGLVLGDVILHGFPETNVHKTLHHLSPQSSGDWQKRIQLLSSCVCLRSPDKWQQRQSQVSCCPNVKVTLTDTTHTVLFRITQYSSAYFCCFVLFLQYWIVAFICMVLAHSSLKWWDILSISLDGLVWEEAGASFSF